MPWNTMQQDKEAGYKLIWKHQVPITVKFKKQVQNSAYSSMVLFVEEKKR